MAQNYIDIMLNTDMFEVRENIRKNIRENLALRRKDANLTRENIADMLIVAPQTIGSWENGRSVPDIASLYALSKLYGISVDAFAEPYSPIS